MNLNLNWCEAVRRRRAVGIAAACAAALMLPAVAEADVTVPSDGMAQLVNGNIGLCSAAQSGPESSPASAQYLGQSFTVPDGVDTLSTYTASLNTSTDQPLTLALYPVDGNNITDTAIWSGTGVASGSVSTDTFTVDQAVTPGDTYMFAILCSSP